MTLVAVASGIMAQGRSHARDSDGDGGRSHLEKYGQRLLPPVQVGGMGVHRLLWVTGPRLLRKSSQVDDKLLKDRLCPSHG
jgi:hypothetical protein